MQHDRILEEVTRTSIKILLKEPFYAHIFSCLSKEVTGPESEVKTMAVGLAGLNHVVYVNERFWDEILTHPDHRYGVVKHEILHIVFKHTLVREPSKDRHLMNIAMDLAVNQHILREQLPAGALLLETFPELHLQKEQTWPYYYEKLKTLQQEMEGRFKGTASAANLAAIQKDSHGLDRHALWEIVETLSETNLSICDSIIDNLLILAHQKTPQNAWGNIPGNIRELLDKLLIRPEPLVDWRRVVKLFSESSSKTKVKNTMKRPSKRFGTVPGIKIKKLKKLLIAVDTSGSVEKQDLEDFFGEIYHLWRQGAEVKVVECDTVIQREYDYRGKTPSFVLGRGGTDFNEPIRFANRVFQPDGLIYFTDGFARQPETTPRCPLLWVITKDGLSPDSDEFKMLPGRKAKLVG